MTFLENNKFTFGKYKNRDIYDILKTNPQYIKWCLDNIQEFKYEIPKDILDSIKQKSKQEYSLGPRASGWLISWLR